jgi:5-methyltetrahydropteroyltriglutamate--homocysteine methyltransferase
VSSTQPHRPPFRADHVGSLLRPARLAEARQGWKAGKVSAADLQAIEDEAITEAVAMQEAIGLQGISDGEFRRDYWHLDFMWGFDGVEPTRSDYTANFSGGKNFVAPAAGVTGKVAYPKDGIMRSHFSYLKGKTRRTAKFTIPAPTMFRHRAALDAISKQVYPDMADFWADLGKAYNDAMRDLHGLGCRYLQLDDVNSTNLCDPTFRQRFADQGDDPDAILDTFIAANNAAIAGRPA